MKIARILNVLAVLALIVAAGIVYRIKYEATRQAEEIARLERAVERERAAIAVLHAEWAHLARPDRIQALAAKNLGLQAPDPHQRVAPGALPQRPPRVDAIGDTIAALGGADALPSEPADDPIARTIEALGLGRRGAAPSGPPAKGSVP